MLHQIREVVTHLLLPLPLFRIVFPNPELTHESVSSNKCKVEFYVQLSSTLFLGKLINIGKSKLFI